ncbi:uncharacterized phage protein (possible DNA packaging) [Phocoenobacter uteri]|uniref:Uncharacterized phage protein (Possible DNA packaging) n=1 Tax=Phocoenobacter uteri TaxID=146806 RepID=A0A379CBB8_9PAST|nr:head-tail connector protein [Phocoenobacter uteri]MDG6880952.1 hypothetical protein [Phocoenobacter uteri]MDG6882797.1 hypothetical protein [Phocoenobacter uteri]SUB58967.1 uncharacterized phage protein (possible DNA packaging) [Phocoenobacter uteri]
MRITLDEVKQQCRIDDTHSDELLLLYLESAKSIIGDFTNRMLFEILPENPPDNALEIDANLKVAILMLVAYLFENRGGWNESLRDQSMALPPTVKLIAERYTYVPI